MSGTVLGTEATEKCETVSALKDKLWEWLTSVSCSSLDRVIPDSLDKMLIILCQLKKLFLMAIYISSRCSVDYF